MFTRVGGSILAGAFLTSSSSHSSNAASSSKSEVTSFENFHTRGGRRTNWQLFISIDLYAVVSNHLDYSYSPSNCCCNGVSEESQLCSLSKHLDGRHVHSEGEKQRNVWGATLIYLLLLSHVLITRGSLWEY